MIHRRKVRAWQMICVLSRFVDDDIVGEVTQCLQIALYRNNLPSVRQYLETFAINIYMKFPSLEKVKDKRAAYEAMASSDSSINLDDIDNRVIIEVLGPKRYGRVRFQGSFFSPTQYFGSSLQ